jgi:hypothetical protein
MVRGRASDDDVGRVQAVRTPTLTADDMCGELQGASVRVELAAGASVGYVACFVSGDWMIASGPVSID